ncbi:hypothetical protein D9M73_177280 [compost metagenome]
MPNGPIDTIANQRIERRAQGQRQTIAKTEIRQDQRDDGVDGPGMQAPVEEGDFHRLPRRLHRTAVTHRWVGEMHHRFGHAEEHQADAHAGGEQHGEPTAAAVFRLAVVRAELDVAIAAGRQEHHTDQYQGHGQDVEPAGVDDDPLLDLIELALGLGLEYHGVEHQQHDQHRTGVENGRIKGTPWFGGRIHRQIAPLNKTQAFAVTQMTADR